MVVKLDISSGMDYAIWLNLVLLYPGPAEINKFDEFRIAAKDKTKKPHKFVA